MGVLDAAQPSESLLSPASCLLGNHPSVSAGLPTARRAVRDLGLHQNRVHHVGQVVVSGVAGRTGDLVAALDPVEWPTDGPGHASTGLRRGTISGSAVVSGKSGRSSRWVSKAAASTWREYALAEAR